MMNLNEPEQILIKLKEKTSTRQRSSLDAVYQICLEQVNREMYDFGVSTIARLGAGRGVPKAQTMRNKTGACYRTLLNSFSNKYKRGKQEQNEEPSESWITNIEDSVLRLQVSILNSQKKRAERLAEEIVPVDQCIEVFDGAMTTYGKTKLTENEKDALKYLLSDEFFRREGLSIGKYGSVVKLDGERFFPVATIDALNKAIESL